MRWPIAILITTVLVVSSASTGAAQASPCDIYAGKVASPTTVVVGQPVEITLTLDGSCPGGEAADTDVLLAIDRSASMIEENRWAATIAAAKGFLDYVQFGPVHVGIVTFSGNTSLLEPEAQVDVPLTADADAVRNGLDAIADPPGVTLWTNLSAAITESRIELTSSRGRPDAGKVLILLTDGDHNALLGPSPVTVAADAKADGITIVTIGLSVNAQAADRLAAIASDPSLFFPAPTPADLQAIYVRVAEQIQRSALTNLVVTDLLPEDVDYVPDSAAPPPSAVETKRLIWNIDVLPPGGWTARYLVRPNVPGTYATNKLAYVEFPGPDGTPQLVNFPVPAITVKAPNRLAIFLPVALQGYCKASRPFDVMLVLDTSSSMAGSKLEQARVAARDFLDFLAMPPTQAGVIAFHEKATVVAELSSDRSMALAALDNLPRGEGTRIDRAVDKATEALTGPRHRTANAPVIILLTDGQQEGADSDVVLDAGRRAAVSGVVVFTIGIGPDVSEELLVALAGDPSRYYAAAGPEQLREIYRGIAGALPCATGGGS